MMLQRRNRFSPFGELRQMQDNMDRMWRRFGTSHHEDTAVPRLGCSA